jgi:hypothetical protein
MGKKQNMSLSRFALSSAPPQIDQYGRKMARAPDFFLLDRLSTTRRAFDPMDFAPYRRGDAQKK